MIELLEYKKKKILSITQDDNNKVHIQFGIKKAKLIMDNIEAIKEFIRNEESQGSV